MELCSGDRTAVGVGAVRLAPAAGGAWLRGGRWQASGLERVNAAFAYKGEHR